MSKKKLSQVELLLKKLGLLAKEYAEGSAQSVNLKKYEKGTPNTGYLKTIILSAATSQADAEADTNRIEIDIPKDLLVRSGSVLTVATANQPYTGAAVGDKYIDLVVNTVSGDATDEHLYIPVKSLVDVYTQGNGISIDGNNVITLAIDANNANGLSVTAAGLKLALATTTTAGAMSAQDKQQLVDLDTSLLTDAEMGSWFGYNATQTATILGSVSDDSITDAE